MELVRKIFQNFLQEFQERYFQYVWYRFPQLLLKNIPTETLPGRLTRIYSGVEEIRLKMV